MTLPIKRPPGFGHYQLHDLLTGKCPRRFYLPPKLVWHINQHLKAKDVSIRMFLTKADQEALDERSD